MNESRIYPITCMNIPEPLYRLFCNFGVPVTKSSPNQIHSAIIITDDALESPADHLKFYGQNTLRISWESLLEELCTPESLDPKAHKPVGCRWVENTISLSENIIQEITEREVIKRLRTAIIHHGLPWVQLSPYPEGYKGVFNFRIDIDEPEPDDWKSVIKSLAPIEPAVTWFLSTRATQQSAQIYDRLKGHDVQSHGHWHHVHTIDRDLNSKNLQMAHDELVSRGFNPTGYAAPCGKITDDLSPHLRSMNYKYLAGIGDLCGSTPQKADDGIWRIHALPVSEGLYLEANIDDVDSVVNGYIAIAERALRNDRPLFWYGHAERRLGRRPQILESLLNHLLQKQGLWHVTISEYLGWLDKRSEIQFEVISSRTDKTRFDIHWNRNESQKSAQIWFEDAQHRWAIPFNKGQGTSTITLDPENSQPLIHHSESPEFELLQDSRGWKLELKNYLDWERETPVDFLQNGPMKRRIKGFLRSWTDETWQQRFTPKAWPIAPLTGCKSA